MNMDKEKEKMVNVSDKFRKRSSLKNPSLDQMKEYLDMKPKHLHFELKPIEEEENEKNVYVITF